MVMPSLALPNWVDLLKSGKAPLPELPLDEKRADLAVKIFDGLRLPDVPGQPMMAEAAGDWFRHFLRTVFGAFDGLKRFITEYLLLVPKKNAKTTNAAAVGLIALLLNKRPNAELLIVAPTQAIADLGYGQAAGMIRADATLSKVFHIREHKKVIVHRISNAELKVKTFDANVMTGTKPVLVIVDELHLLGKMAAAKRVIAQITGGIIANPEGAVIYITTQSDEAPAGVFKSKLTQARAIRDGKSTARLLGMLYEFPANMQADEGKPWNDPANWPMVTPNMGRSIDLDRLIALRDAAQEEGEEEFRIFASQHLNVEIGIAITAEGWTGAQYWEQSGETIGSLDELMARCEVATVGIDGGGLDDLFGLSVIGREPEVDGQPRKWWVWGKAWAHPEVLNRRETIETQLREFEVDGDLVICGDAEPLRDVMEAAAICARLNDAGLLPEQHAIGLDPVGVSAVIDELSRVGIADEQMASVKQGYSLASAVWGAERKLKDGTFRHLNQPMMAWCVGNAKIEQTKTAVMVTKQASGRAKIDPFIALLNGFWLMSRNPEPPSVGTYLEDDELLIL